MRLGRRPASIGVAAAALSLALAACHDKRNATAVAIAPPGPPSVTLSPDQLKVISIGTVGSQDFTPQTGSVGNIDFDEDSTVQVFSPYQGKIISAFARMGDEVRKGQPLFTVESPDLMSATSSLIAAHATEIANAKALARARQLHATQGISDQNLEQAVSAEAASHAAEQAARQALFVFGKSDADIRRIAVSGRVDSALVVRSPISGRITARNAQPGLLVQPGSTPAPYTVGDTSTMWMVADASETDATRFRSGQPLDVIVPALPGRTFEGHVQQIAANVDPTVHTVQLRSTIPNADHALLAGMQANFHIHTGNTVHGLSVPSTAIVREGDGTLTAWVTTDRHHFTQRVVLVGMSDGDSDQVLGGLKAGEQIVTNGAVYLDNMLTASPDDD